EIADYRSRERLARSLISNWRIAATHQVDTFERVSFPVRIESIHETGQLLDTMQEGRYERYLAELGGLSAEDEALLCRALAEAVRFQIACLPRRKPIVPFSTMISALTLYKKLVGFKSDIGSVLEVGPGCGYLSIFLAQTPSLTDYSQVEACESFYIFQSLLNGFLFRHRFCELATTTGYDLSLNIRADIDAPYSITDREIPPYRCFHFPWWTLGALHERTRYYDVVTSNANLNEFTRDALHEYLTIFKRVMKDDGIFLEQCTGSEGHGTREGLFDVLHDAGFSPVFCALAEEEVERLQVALGAEPFLPFRHKRFAVNNLILVKQEHPLYAGSCSRDHFSHGYAAAYDRLPGMYLYGEERRPRSKDELMAGVKAELLRC
ncbi:MAG TPA: hypothetical protein VKU84_08780, partial [Stellaceae bacterium]|nr:hypothetical protein [Stellaceae bacterium]